jgi:telomerase reverse transcriptase
MSCQFLTSTAHSARQNTFYCTESSAYRNKVLYFRQDDWQTLCQPLIERLVSVTFEKLPSVSNYCFLYPAVTHPLKFNPLSVIKTRRLGFSFVRLLPKDTGVRPIVNLRHKPPKKVYPLYA